MRSALPPTAFTWSQAQAGARALSPTSDPLKILVGALILTDTLIVLVSSAGAYVLRHGSLSVPLEIASITFLAVALTLNAMKLAGAYNCNATSTAAGQVGSAMHGWSLVFAMLVILGYLTKTSDDFSRTWAIGWYVLALVGFALARLYAVSQVQRWRRRGKLARIVAIVDLAGTGDKLARQLYDGAMGQMRLVGVFSPRRTSLRKNGLDDLIALARLFRIDEVVVTVSGQQDGETDAIVRKLGTLPTNVRLCPELPPMTVVPREAGLLFGHHVLTVYHRPLTGWNHVAKRAEDLIIASLTLIPVVPLMAVIALLIRLDSPGPILFRQKRLGFNNNVIVVYKFRTMLHRSAPETSVPQAARNDPRITRLGRFLRRSSIDELPQLFNVLKGEMSLVGPRPHALAHNDQYAGLIDEYLGRHRVQPGITGWAQVNGFRGETETLEKMQRRVDYDLAYIDHWSLSLDLKILFLTLLRGAFAPNAY